MHQPFSAIEVLTFRGRTFYVKRDDTIDPLLSGNKYRKLYSLIQTPSEKYTDVVSYGGTQSNAMLSIAALCQQKGWRFHYTSKTVPTHLRAKPTGNLKKALEVGMQLYEVAPKAYEEAISKLKIENTIPTTLLIPQGGADPLAKSGIEVLADEIKSWLYAKGITKLNVITPSGTGTTAYYLAAALKGVDVITTPVVGDKFYLTEQMKLLGPIPANLHIIESRKKMHFGKPYAELLAIYQELKQNGIEFDLIYAAKMWLVLMEYADNFEGEMLYIHSGGLIGNETMLERYRYKRLF